MSYRAVWDSRVWAWSAGTLAVLALVLLMLLRESFFARPMRFGVAGLAAVLIVVLLVATVAFAPRSYVVDGTNLHVRTVLARFTYDLRHLSEVRTASAKEVFSPGTLRTFGSGGLFGYYGYFKNPRLGKFLAFVTNLDRLVVLRFPQGTLVISPDDPQGFLQELHQKLEY